MLSANEAKVKSQIANLDFHYKREITLILESISESAERGSFAINVDHAVSEPSKKILEKLKYKLTYHRDEGEDFTHISWGD